MIELPTNQAGKGRRYGRGESDHGRIILLLDADLIGLTPQHVKELVTPIISQQAMMAIGYFTAGRLHRSFPTDDPLSHRQRAVRRELFAAPA